MAFIEQNEIDYNDNYMYVSSVLPLMFCFDDYSITAQITLGRPVYKVNDIAYLLSANLGGQMGLFLGASILTLGEVAELMVLAICTGLRRLIIKFKNL